MDRVKLRSDLARDEGFKNAAYQDSNGWWTIGVGHLLGPTQRILSLTDVEIWALLEADINNAEKLAQYVVPLYESMNDTRQRALVNMAFNRGGHLVKSTSILPAIVKATLTKNDDDWKIVAQVIKASPWASQIGARADRLAFMFETGGDPA